MAEPGPLRQAFIIQECTFDLNNCVVKGRQLGIVIRGRQTFGNFIGVAACGIEIANRRKYGRKIRVEGLGPGRPCPPDDVRADVGEVLRGGTNTLEVRFRPPVTEGAGRAAAHPWPIPHQEPDASATRAFSRKAAYQYGWDWGPRYVTSGIWRPVRLEAWSGVRITDAWVTSVEAGPDTVTAVLVVELDVSAPGSVRVGVRSADHDFDAAVEDVEMAAPGRATVRKRLAFPSGELWWPRGSSQGRPRLYEVDVDAVQGRRWDRRSTRVGLRTVALDTTRDAEGSRFLFFVNGTPVFARGANVVPPDHFTPRADSATYTRLLDDAVAANMNMVRVWGGVRGIRGRRGPRPGAPPAAPSQPRPLVR